MACELLSVVYPWEDLKTKRRRRRSKQWTGGSKRHTLEMDTDHLTRRPSRTHLRRALRAPLISLQYPLQQPLQSQPHIQMKISSAYFENCGSNEPFTDETGPFIGVSAKISGNNS